MSADQSYCPKSHAGARVWRRSPAPVLGALCLFLGAAGESAASEPPAIDPRPPQSSEVRAAQVGAGTDERSEPAGAVEFDLPAAEALCQEFLACQAVPGFAVALVGRAGTQTLCFGVVSAEEAGKAAAEPIRPETLFEIGSLTKVFTGILLAEAVVRGAAHLDDPVTKLLPEGWSLGSYAGASGPEPILLWHLSTHTSGLPRVPLQLMSADPLDPYRDYGPEELRGTLAALRLKRAPGAGYAYSNLGAGLLGFCLAGDGRALDAAYRQRVLVPLGLLDTGIQLTSEQASRLSGAHGEGGRAAGPWAMDALAGAGALRSSIVDLARFAQIELDPATWAAAPSADQAAPQQRVLLRSALELAARQHWRSPDQPESLALGLGWHLNPAAGTRWHNGQTGGFHSFLGLHPEAGVGVVVLANAATPLVDQLGGRLLELLLGRAVEPLGLERPISLPVEDLNSFVGEYALGSLRSLRVSVEPAGLFGQFTGGEVQRLYPRSRFEFFMHADEGTLRFLPDESGVVQELVLLQRGTEKRGRRK